MKPRRHRHDVRLTPDDVAYLGGLLDAFDDLPDGAWQSACEDAIANSDRFKGRDAYEVWIAWCWATRDTDEKKPRREPGL